MIEIRGKEIYQTAPKVNNRKERGKSRWELCQGGAGGTLRKLQSLKDFVCDIVTWVT